MSPSGSGSQVGAAAWSAFAHGPFKKDPSRLCTQPICIKTHQGRVWPIARSHEQKDVLLAGALLGFSSTLQTDMLGRCRSCRGHCLTKPLAGVLHINQ
eukprot:15472518-Alexandrium_andersonii.AAC.2